MHPLVIILRTSITIAVFSVHHVFAWTGAIHVHFKFSTTFILFISITFLSCSPQLNFPNFCLFHAVCLISRPIHKLSPLLASICIDPRLSRSALNHFSIPTQKTFTPAHISWMSDYCSHIPGQRFIYRSFSSWWGSVKICRLINGPGCELQSIDSCASPSSCFNSAFLIGTIDQR